MIREGNLPQDLRVMFAKVRSFNEEFQRRIPGFPLTESLNMAVLEGMIETDRGRVVAVD